MVLDCAAGDCSDSAISLRGRRGGDAPVELAAATALRLADTRLLAGTGIAGTVPDSVRRTWAWGAGTAWWAALRTRLPEDESGGAGKASAGNG